MGEEHKPTPKTTGMLDCVECSCGWVSPTFFDGMAWAMREFKRHKEMAKILSQGNSND